MSSSERYNLSLTALFIGVPVLVGASCYYFYITRNTSSKKSSSKDSADNKKNGPLDQVMRLKQTGNQNFSRKNYDVAIEHYTQAIELSQTIEPSIKLDDLAIFYQNRAACYEAIGNVDKVLEDCSKAIELRNTYVKAYSRRARAYEKLEDFDNAMVDAFCANLLEKFQNQSSMLLTENIVKASSSRKAKEAMKTHKPKWPADQTVKNYFSAFTHDPVKELLKDEIIKSFDQLEPIFKEANKPENDNDPRSLLVRGSCLSLLGEMKKAQECFDKILAFSDNECSLRIKANSLIKKSALIISDPTTFGSNIEKELEQVFELLEQAIAIDPENSDIYLHKAQGLTLSEKYDEAVAALSKAIEFKEDCHPAIAQKLYIEFKIATRDSCSSNKMKEMLDNFKKIVQENPESQDLLSMYAQVLTELSYFKKADQALLDLIKLDPSDASYYISRALIQFNLNGEQDRVATLLREALDKDPKVIFAYEILGSIESQLGKIDEAIKIFENALTHAQTEAEYARCYGLLDSAKGQRKAAELLGM